MKVKIENCSSPGASFTTNTDKVILKCNELIKESPKKNNKFSQFRRDLVEQKGVNGNNARNIYPFLKNCGFVSYEAGAFLKYDDFFTKRGIAYVKTLEAIQMLPAAEASDENKKRAKEKLQQIKEQIIFEGLKSLLRVPDSNYTQVYVSCLKYLLKYKKINKVEFGYILYEKELHPAQNYLENMHKNVETYRDGKLDIEVCVSIRNDIEVRRQTNQERRIENISFLTAFSYIIGTLQQGGIVTKIDYNYYVLKREQYNSAEDLIKGALVDD